jgi:DNA-binding CsgD family transcriptional regulator
VGRVRSSNVWSSEERALVGDAIEQLNTLHLDGRDSGIGLAIQVLTRVASAERGVAYSFTRDKQRWRVFESQSRGLVNAGEALTASLDRVAAASKRFGLYNPGSVEPAQRGVAIASAAWKSVLDGVLPAALQRLPIDRAELQLRLEGTSQLGEAAKTFGLFDLPQLRVLACDGAVAQTWVGVYREKPFAPRDVARVQLAMPAMVRRLRTERRLGRSGLPTGLSTLIEHIAGVAFVLNTAGEVLLANAAGRESLDLRGAETRSRLARAERGELANATSTAMVECGLGPMRLVVLPVSRDTTAQALRAATARYALTPRESEVLGALLDGASNLHIAAKFECSERTVEVHISRILGKTGCASRAEVVAQVLRKFSMG